MAAMDKFGHILNWKLKRGSHTFPGQDGGTCINEAAIVAAGFPYQPVRSVHDMPKCFSRPICALAMQLNDEASDEERQHFCPSSPVWPVRTHWRRIDVVERRAGADEFAD